MVSTADIERAARLIRDGEIVAFPTETVYGLGADARYGKAVAKIFEAKGRPRFDPLIVHVATTQAAWELAREVPVAARALAEAFWPGPLTLVLPKVHCRMPKDGTVEVSGIPDIVTAGLGTVGIRVPSHPVARALVEAAESPIAAPSANRFGGISPTRAEHVTVPYAMVLDGGPCATGVESTVIGFNAEGRAVLLRPGGTAAEEIESVLGAGLLRPDPNAAPDAPMSPGMLDRHYAPRTPLRLVEESGALRASRYATQTSRTGLLRFYGGNGTAEGFAHIETLSPTGNLTEAAANLFDAMHRLDAAGLDLIVAERVPHMGLGRAINDRLRRASYGV